jgi:ribonuclease HI
VDRGSNCGAGGTIFCSDLTNYRWHFNGGDGTNTKVELLGMWASLFLSKKLDIQYIQLIGDSKIVIDWLKKKGNLQAINIEGWKGKIKESISSFRGIYFQHILREANMEADKCSKQEIETTRGRLTYASWDGKNTGTYLHFDIF